MNTICRSIIWKMTGQDQERSRKFPAYLALGAGVGCIGLSAIFVKLAGVPGPVSALYRMLVAGLVLVPWRLARRGSGRPSRADVLWITVGGILFALDVTLWNTSLLLTSAATATLLANNAPLWVGLGALWLLRERLSGRYWLGLVISFAGMSCLIGLEAWQQLRINSGNLLALGASVLYAGYLLTTQRVRARVDTLTFMTISVGASILVLISVNLALGTALVGFSGKTWMALAGLGLVSHLGGWLAINFALGHLRAAPVSVSLLGQAVVTALLAIPILGEGLKLSQIIGGTLVLGGIYFVNRQGLERKR